MAYMRQLAEAGRTDELRAVIIQAQGHSSDIWRVWWERNEDIYQSQVKAMTRWQPPGPPGN
ncbi:MAG TPA: hypothetical protein VF345_06870 [Chthoniobacterales bacterium]